MLEEIRALPPWQPTRAWKDWQAQRDALLNRFINEQLYPFSPFYRRLFDDHKIDPKRVRRVADLRHMPLTAKQDIAPTDEHPTRPLELVLQPSSEAVRDYAPWRMKSRLLLQKLRHGEAYVKEKLRLEYAPLHVTFTTGRTAQPTQFLYTSMDFERLHLVGKRLIDVCRIAPGERALNVFPYAPHLAFWQVFAVGQAATMLIVHTGGGKVMGTAGNVAALERLQPEMMIGVPGYVYHLLRQANEQRVRLSKLKCIALGAERVPSALKVRLATLCNEMGRPDVAVQGVYGFTEARQAWGECATSDCEVSYGYHTYPDLEIFEIIDPESGQSLGAGERGEIVYTTLTGRGSCVLRYRTGDIAEHGLLYDPCPNCGRIVPRIAGAVTRRSDVGEFQLTKIRGTLVDLNSFIPVMAEAAEVVEWQLLVRKLNDDADELDELVLNVALRDGADAAQFKQRICQRLLSCIEVAPNLVQVLPLKQIETDLGLDTQLKETRIRDMRNAKKAPVGA